MKSFFGLNMYLKLYMTIEVNKIYKIREILILKEYLYLL